MITTRRLYPEVFKQESVDRVASRVFRASTANVLWVSDFTHVSTWTDFLYVAFVIDVYARRHLSPEPAQVLTLPHRWPTWRG